MADNDMGDIEGMDSSHRKLLKKAGINTIDDLFNICRDPVKREDMVQITGISDDLLIDWANKARRRDLMRIGSISEDYSDILGKIGVNKVADLARRCEPPYSLHNLHETLMVKIRELESVIATPGKNDIVAWVEEAKNLPPISVAKRERGRMPNVRVLIEVAEIRGWGYCNVVHLGQKWIYPDNVEGLCTSALNCMLPTLWTLRWGGKIPPFRTNGSNTILFCCSDATRPVVYSLTRIENDNPVKHHLSSYRNDTNESL